MSILTIRELEFLASLRTNWSQLYWSELADLLKEGGGQRPAHRQANAIAQVSRQAASLTRNSKRNFSVFGPDDRDRTA